MALFPGWTAPDFTIDTALGPVRFHAWLAGGWGIVVTHPDDYSPQSLRSAVAWARSGARPVRLLGLASSGHEARQVESLEFPIIQDGAEGVAALWRGFSVDVGPAGTTLDEHMVFVLDPARTIRTTVSYPPSRNRDFAEIIQVVEACDTGCAALRDRRAA
ncbi:putative peroxiredoxin [Gluconacetobacter diazotrophicus PA1 5]|uniref:Peroxiredoxin n=2 Tax=Gluconacetobacter diazotrophicus TaxID=33996 RepID=A0A7W4I795_GLUDI|nr:peroxiredoxin [Gluconacetobacter diazotrophicus]ACI50655.1 putative peroxiredoxin [Gluconacetobacter diazotrophicus PA1 5]MBB2157477.1 peroxiredoxin [Gluconacetobacter diazotrophicus]TWB09487.1 alkyl hydroperoxide reductase subunit AhpC [Gluconacetobacter diazotrophicus]CAP56595.1 putative peroxiredoxin [Gluconacetobacter diazotrophicus PA1 5]